MTRMLHRKTCRRLKVTRRIRLERLEDRTMPSFFGASAFPAGVVPSAVEVGDFNGNGFDDIFAPRADES